MSGCLVSVSSHLWNAGLKVEGFLPVQGLGILADTRFSCVFDKILEKREKIVSARNF